MTLTERVTTVLDDAGVAHALIGAAALAAAGVVRSTLDIDLLVIEQRVLDPALWTALRSAGVEVDVRRGDADDPLAGVVRASMSGERPVDVIVGRHAWERRAIERARAMPSGRRVVLPRDVVLLKLYAGGTQDMWDVAQLLAALEESALVSEVEEELSDLPPQAAVLWGNLRAGR